MTLESDLLQPVIRLNKDAIRILGAGGSSPQGGSTPVPGSVATELHEARALVDLYYSLQELRKSVANQIGAIERGADTGVTHEASDYLLEQAKAMEQNAQLFLETAASRHPMWPWFVAVHGIGPVLSAGLIAHLGARAVPVTVGHWWRHAGLDPSQKWLGANELAREWDSVDGDVYERVRAVSLRVGRDPETVIRDATTNFKTGESTGELTKAKALKSLARIPFNRPLKTLLWKVVDQFVKLGERSEAYKYAKWYRARKALEVERNLRGDRAAQAAAVLERRTGHAQRATYAKGLLPDSHVDAMARRATAKLFLSHLHELWYQVEHGAKPPAPFSNAIQRHAHYIAPFYSDAVLDSSKK